MSSRPQEKSQNPKPKKDKEKEKEKEEEIIEERISSINGDLKVRQYLKQKHLGKGAFASVFEIEDLETHEKFAAKIISKDLLRKNQSHHKVLNEVQIHKSMNHPNIVKFERVFEDRQNVYIIVELCSKNTLRKFIKKSKRLPELDVQHYLYQIIDGVQHIHDNGVVHRDLKLGNLFLTKDMQIKIGDFGLANKSGPDMERRKTVCGTPNYVAPEILSKAGHSFEADIWSLGVITYTMLVGTAPFETTDVKITYKRIQKGEFTFPTNLCLSECARDFVSKLLTVNPAKRLTIEQMLKHPFMRVRGEIPDHLPLSTSKDWNRAKFMEALRVKKSPKKPAPIESPEPSEDVAALRISSEPQKEFKAFKPYLPPKIKQSFTPTYRKQSFKPISTVKKPASSPEKISSSATIKKGWLPSIRKHFTNAGIKRESPMTSKDSPMPKLESQDAHVHILNYLEYPKYGVGYQLSNNQIGVLFNDSTKIILNPSFMTFEYVKKEAENEGENNVIHDMAGYPNELAKKVACLQRFMAFFGVENNKENVQPKSGIKKSAHGIISLEKKTGNNTMVYVRKLIKAQEIVIFRLSNQTLQVFFKDGISIIVNHPKQLVTYIDIKGVKSQFHINYVATCDNQDVISRLKQMQDILKQVREVEKARENKQEKESSQENPQETTKENSHSQENNSQSISNSN